jgi:hypothetical protein
MEEVLKQILEKIDGLEKGQLEMKSRFDHIDGELNEITKTLIRIDKKVGTIPSTYEEHEKLLGRAITDIELLKKLVLNQ